VRLLLVEDNRQLSDWVAKTLRAERYTVDCVYAGDDADHVLRTEEYALVILDLALPELGGLEILRKLRARGSTVPVIILTANDTLDARVAGLNSGADDYLAKPFEMTELEARIRAHLRRAQAHPQTVVQCGTLVFDSNRRQFALGDEPLALTAREHAVLETLILRAGATVSKGVLTTTVFGFDDEANPNAIEIYVHRVRKKLAGSDISIVTLRGLGYVLKAGDAG
jgi:two-component system, OmpR family, response regulator TctD